MKSKSLKFFIFSVVFLGVGTFSIPAGANMKILKAYKEAFPDASIKCIGCHVDAMPKKGGDHENNDYGKAIKAAAAGADVTADTIKTLGKAEDFKK
ncbi:MAG: hypothetical protein WCH62_01405 [Candidatus Omnitrophota bacterium]